MDTPTLTMSDNLVPKLNITDSLYNYAIKIGAREHAVLQELRKYTAQLPMAHLQIPIDQGQLFAMLARIHKVKTYLEIGVFTGYSTLTVALSMPQDGKITALDNNLQVTAIAQKFWQKAKVNHKIDLRIGDARDSLQQLLDNGQQNSFDMAFIDANKSSYAQYYEYCYHLVRDGGIILVDNVLIQGRVLEEKSSTYVRAIQEFNQLVYNDIRVEICTLPIADGLTILYKIPINKNILKFSHEESLHH